MCLHSQLVYLIPEETERVARAVLPKDNIYLRMYEELGAIFADPQFSALFPKRGQPAESPARLALVLVLQFLENLTDRQAANAVRTRIDWKYLLGLELTDNGFDYSLLSEFRDRLIKGQVEQLLLDTLLTSLQEAGLFKARGRQRTDSTHILAAVHSLNRLELVGRTLQQALNVLAQQAPQWLRAQITDAWFDRYSRLIDEYHLPKGEAERRTTAEVIGADGLHLLTQLEQAAAPLGLRELPVLQILQQVWQQQYSVVDGQVRWREMKELPPSAERIASPYDPQARYSTKRSVSWVGYKVHLTETCDEERPNLIVHVTTTAATTDDSNALATIHADLAKEERLPGEHIVDTAYNSGEIIVSSMEQHQVRVIGPVRPDVSWQAQDEQAYDSTAFSINWDAQQAVCPEGHISRHWHTETGPHGKATIQIQFDPQDCKPCAVRERCTRSKTAVRELTLHPQAAQEALEQARQYQQSAEFKSEYALRAGVEGTISEAVVAHEMRRSRYIGLQKTHLQHILTAVAINLLRAIAWWQGKPKAPTRKSAFAALAPS